MMPIYHYCNILFYKCVQYIQNIFLALETMGMLFFFFFFWSLCLFYFIVCMYCMYSFSTHGYMHMCYK